jgi:hypothetical protein
MTVNEMVERLQEVAEDGFGECELRLAFQPNWALQFTVGGIAVPDDESRGAAEPDEEPDDAASVVYIVEGGHPADDSPYAPGWAFAAAR